jgi:hypothetical protein
MIMVYSNQNVTSTPSRAKEHTMDTSRTPARPTMSVPAAGQKYYGLSKAGSYEAARRGDIPTIKVGGRIFAVVRAIEERLAAVR